MLRFYHRPLVTSGPAAILSFQFVIIIMELVCQVLENTRKLGTYPKRVNLDSRGLAPTSSNDNVIQDHIWEYFLR